MPSFSFFFGSSGSEDFSGIVSVESLSNVGQMAVEASGSYCEEIGDVFLDGSLWLKGQRFYSGQG